MKHSLTRRFISSLAIFALLAGNLSGIAIGADVEPAQLSMPDRNTTPLHLWYTKPSSSMPNAGKSEKEMWQQYTLPIGNGDMGANVYGEIITERLSLNEKTLWTGGPSSSRPDYNGGNLEEKGRNGATQDEIVALFNQGKTAEAVNKANQLTGLVGEYGDTYINGYGAYQPWGELKIQYTDITDTTGVTAYSRDLSLNDALAGVTFTTDGTTYTREYLMSHPDNVLAAKLTATGSKKLNLTLTLPSSQGGTTVTVGNDTLKLSGEVSDNQLKYASFLKAVPVGGTVTGNGAALTVTGASEVYLYFSAATDYANDYPVYRTGETMDALNTRVKADVDAAATKGYTSVKTAHIADYKSLFDRMSLNIGQATTQKTTDELLIAYNNGTASESEQRLLETMLFQYGRYLTIGSSREDSQLPSNLQGVWNNQLEPAWHSDYHMNVNLQMNYWPTYSTNLSECADPLIRYIDSLREPGRVTAEIYAGVESTDAQPENGFMAHTQNTPFGWTCPGWAFTWGWSPAAVPWMLQNCWDYYDFTRDLDYMKNNIYPMMKEEAKLYDQMLVPDKDGKLVSAPAYSPEHGPVTMGNTYEQTLVWQLYEDTIAAAELVGETDTALIQRWKDNQANLKGPIEIGESGQIKEWYAETTVNTMEDSEGYGHRHLSHMLGLFPGDLIQSKTEWVEAARVSMENRTDESTGWGMGQRINTWARLDDGNKSYKLITDLFKKGIYSNLWDTHAPFQIDGNFGMTSGVAEMLLQSNMGYIDLLPSLPDVWENGCYDGLLARGNFEIGATWSEGGVDKVTILSHLGGDAVIEYPNLSLAMVADENGNFIPFTSITNDRISFPTQQGTTYTIINLPKQTHSEVENLVAYRLTDREVQLSWDAENGSSYQVYRKIDGGELLAIGTPVSAGAFTDTTAFENLGTKFSYTVAQIKDGQTSAPVNPVVAKDLRDMGMLDDRDPRVEYSGGWSVWPGKGEGNYKDTVSFIEARDATGTETATLLFLGTGIELATVKGAAHGTLAISIDNGTPETADCHNASRLAQQTVFSKSDLTFGLHTIKVQVEKGKKVELDAFNVLNQSGTPPTSIAVTSVSGVTTLSKSGSTLQMQASVAPVDAKNKDVIWSVANRDGTATTAATINDKGLLTAGNSSGSVTVTATSVQAPSVKGTFDITISLPAATIVDDTEKDKITYIGGWSVWNGEGEGNYNDTVTFIQTPTGTESFSMDFTGTGIEMMVVTNAAYGKFRVKIDETTYPDVDCYSPIAVHQNTVFSDYNLTAGPHKITVNVVGTKKVELDGFKIYTSSTVDKSSLLAAIQANQGKITTDYTAETWAPFKTAFEAAVTLMNSDNVTIAQITAAVATLNSAATALVTAPPVAPSKPDTTDATIQVLSIGGTTATLNWTAVEGATTYNIYLDSTSGTKVASTNKTAYTLTGLTSGKSFTYVIEAENEGGKSALPASATFTTLDTQPPEMVENLVYTENKLTWSAAIDNVGTIGYMVYVDGSLKGNNITNTEYDLSTLNLDMDVSHLVQVVAYDVAGNKSPSATLTLGAVVIKCTISFVADGTTIHTEKILSGGSLATSAFPAVPKKVGYTGAWDVTTDITNIAESMTVTAIYTAESYTVTFDANSGTLDGDATKDVTFDAPYGDLPTATTDDATKTFDGWYTEAEAGIQVTADTILSIAEDHTLYAHWRSMDHSATPNTSVSGMVKKITLPYSSDITLTVGNVSTYTYQWQRDIGNGWENLDNETEHTYTIPNSDIVIDNNGWKYRCSITNTEDGKLPTNAPGGVGVALSIEKGVASAPTGLEGHMPTSAEASDGSITGLNDKMSYEYKMRDSADAYAPLTATTKLASGAYLVRFAETNDLFASPDVEVFIPAYTDSTIPVTGVTLDQSSVSLYSNRAPSSVQLTATVAPENATNKSVQWSSNNEAVATVENGLVTAIGNGTAIITATAVDGGMTASCTVTITTYTETPVPVTGVTLNQSNASLYSNQTPSSIQLTATVTPDNAVNKSVKWSSNNEAVATVENGLVTAVESGTAIITATAVDGGMTASCTITVTTYTDPVSPPSGNTSGSGSTSSSGTVTKNEDGSTTTTVVDKKTGAITESTVMLSGDKTVVVKQTNGSSVTTTQAKNGATSTITVDAAGKTDASVTLPSSVVTATKKDESILLPMPKLTVTTEDKAAVNVAVSIPEGNRVKVAIPVLRLAPGMVVIQVNTDGSETILKTSHMTDDGLIATLTGSTVLKVVDRSKTFFDLSAKYWASDAVQFVTSRELFQGVGDNNFAPTATMTRSMLVTVLHRLSNEPKADKANFTDVPNDAWYANAVSWASENGIAAGTGTDFMPDSAISREQLVIMLYRYAEKLDLDTKSDSSTIENFADRDSVSSWAVDAMSWAVTNGVLTGKTDELLDSTGSATRAEVSAILYRFISLM